MGDVNGLVANSVGTETVAGGSAAAGSAVGRDGRFVDSVREGIKRDKAIATVQLQAVGVQLSGESQAVARKKKELALAKKNEEINFVERLMRAQEEVTVAGRLAMAKLQYRLQRLLLDKKELKSSLGLSVISTTEAGFVLKFLKTETKIVVPTLKSGAEKRSFVAKIFGEQPELEVRFLEWKATLQELGTARVARNLEAIASEDATPEQPATPQEMADATETETASEQPVASPDATQEQYDCFMSEQMELAGKVWDSLEPWRYDSRIPSPNAQPVADATPSTKAKRGKGKKQPA